MPRIVTYPDKQVWLDARKGGLGGSDAYRLMCGDRVELWSEKVGLSEPEDLSGNPYVQAGTRLEPVILDWYEELSGRVVERLKPYTTYWSDKYGWMFCTPDAMQENRGVVEVKSVHAYLAKEWEGGVPEEYLWQLIHNVIATGSLWGTLVAMIGKQEPIWYDYYDFEMNAPELITAERKFWRLVETETPPEPDENTDKESVTEDEDADAEPVELIGELMDETRRYDRLRRGEKIVKSRIKEIKNRIRQAMGGATEAYMPDGTGWTLRENKHGTRTLRRRKS